MSNKVAEHQRQPEKNDKPCIQDLVIADIEARKKVGIERYGTVLQPFNGRSALLDAYQEALDLCQYLRQLLYEEEEYKKAYDEYLEGDVERKYNV